MISLPDPPNFLRKPQEERMKFRPLHDRVVVERIDPEAKSAGGIIIPDTAQEKPSQGEIIAVGPGGRDESGKLIPIDLKVGDRVLFGKWSGTEVKLDGVDFLIMKESDIMGVLQEDGGQEEGRLSIPIIETEIHGVAKCLPKTLDFG